MNIQNISVNLNQNVTINFLDNLVYLNVNYFQNNSTYDKITICDDNNRIISKMIANKEYRIFAYDSNNISKQIGKIEVYNDRFTYTVINGINCTLYLTGVEDSTNESDPYSLHLDGSNSPTANINWNNHRITNLANPVDSFDLCNKNYVDNLFDNIDVNNFLKIDGSNSPTDDIVWNNKRITNLSDPINEQDAITLKYMIDNYNSNNNSNNNQPQIPTPGNTALIGGGESTMDGNFYPYVQSIDKKNISNSSNATNYGNLYIRKAHSAEASNCSNNKILSGGGFQSGLFIDDYGNDNVNHVNLIEYINVSNSGNGSYFDDLHYKIYLLGAASNSVDNKAVFIAGSGYQLWSKRIDIVSFENGINTNFFGECVNEYESLFATDNGIYAKAVYGTGYKNGSNSICDNMETININTTYNGTFFGHMYRSITDARATSSRENNIAIVMGGYNGSGTFLDDIYYFNIESFSSATTFGNLIQALYRMGVTSNGTNNIAIGAGGKNGVGTDKNVNQIQSCHIDTPANATSYGNLTGDRGGPMASSNA